MIFPFLLALFTACFATAFFPNLRLIAFAPFLALVYLRKDFPRSLWLAFWCGLIMDCLTSQFFLGLQALNYLLATLLLYRQKRHFFEDKSLSLPLFTAIVSLVSTILHWMFLYALDKKIPMTWKFAAIDLLIMPLLDAVYAFVWFTCPMQFYHYVRKVGWKKLFFKESI